ncbi:hypothetical protein N8551_02315, partial [Akkermansiaceae bacterium]|nr:hypothetical protein [Akkermansiaceae bacterium]
MMTSYLDYPFDNAKILRKHKSIKKQLLKTQPLIVIKVAVLGGSTTSQLISILELFLLKNGFQPSFYESQYNKIYEDSVFENLELKDFNPDIIYIHTTHYNITEFPSYTATADQIDTLRLNELQKFQNIWNGLQEYNCPIIQNNFDYPMHRSLGNLDCYDIHGKTYFLSRLNLDFAAEAQKNAAL